MHVQGPDFVVVDVREGAATVEKGTPDGDNGGGIRLGGGQGFFDVKETADSGTIAGFGAICFLPFFGV
jgi:hypothetical protein